MKSATSAISTLASTKSSSCKSIQCLIKHTGLIQSEEDTEASSQQRACLVEALPPLGILRTALGENPNADLQA